MRKILMALAVMVVAIAVSAPHIASASSLKVSGAYIWRGISSDNGDQTDIGKNDAQQRTLVLIRPRWTFTSLKGKIKAIYELDFAAGGFRPFGSTEATSRRAVGLNRFTLDFAVPGTKIRARIGKTDWRSPDRELVGGGGLHRIDGYGFYGKLSKSLSFNLFNTQVEEGNADASDNNNYLLSLTWKAPGLTISPWLGYEKHGGVSRTDVVGGAAVATGTAFVIDDTSTERDIWWYGLNVKAKFGKFNANVSGVIVDGTLDFSRGVNNGTIINPDGTTITAREDTAIEAYAILIRTWLQLNRSLKVGFHGVFMPGDDDPTSAVGDLGTQPDNKLTRFTPFHTRGSRDDTVGSCRVGGPQIVSNRRYHTLSGGFNGTNNCLNGSGGIRGNGTNLYELLFSWKVAKSLTLAGNYSIVRTAAPRATIDNNNNGIEDAGDTLFVDSKNVGSEIDIHAAYTIMPRLSTTLTFSHLFAGDYGKSATIGTRDFDDTWQLVWQFRHFF